MIQGSIKVLPYKQLFYEYYNYRKNVVLSNGICGNHSNYRWLSDDEPKPEREPCRDAQPAALCFLLVVSDAGSPDASSFQSQPVQNRIESRFHDFDQKPGGTADDRNTQKANSVFGDA
jgi:hypothetical protein